MVWLAYNFDLRFRLIDFAIKAEMNLTESERGPEVSFQCIFLVGGCAFAYWVDFGFTCLDNQLSWMGEQHFSIRFWIFSQ